jgi:predicted nucleic acid-binding protein
VAVSSLLDTNAALYLLGGRLAKPLLQDQYAVSFITEMELLSYPLLSADEEAKVQAFLADVGIYELSREIKTAAIRLRRERGLKLPDAIICATAMQHNATLWSNDQKLANVPGLRCRQMALKAS